jgi:hypothetical protein
MNIRFSALRNAVTSKAGRQILQLQKHSPVILFSAGVIGVVAAAVMASRATLKLDGVLTEHQETTAKMQFNAEHLVDYTEDMHRHDKMVLLAHTSGKITKLYAPGVAVGLLSICALTGSHIILNRRNLSLTAAYAALDRGFQSYRERVVKELGHDKDDEFKHGYEERTVAVDTKDGTTTETIRTAGPGSKSPYSRYFDEGASEWKRDAEDNRIFLQYQQNYWNDYLQAHGHVFLNQIYKALGLEPSRAGQSVGWALGEGRDNYISFGVFDRMHDYKVRDFVNLRERSILLDFNVDGPILGLISREY